MGIELTADNNEKKAAPLLKGDALRDSIQVIFLTAILVIISEAIGKVNIPVGPAKILLLPMVWGIIMGVCAGSFNHRLPAFLSVNLPQQWRASSFMQIAMYLLVAKLGVMVGGNLPMLKSAGPVMVVQEIGHVFGPILIGLPIALLLGIKREAVGATFSIGREISIALIADRYGMDSPEGRGVMAEFITGSLISAIFISILAGSIASLGIFDPRALAMGAGVGSASMGAAAAGAVAAVHRDMADTVLAFTAAANLITMTIGTYLILFISLPVCSWAYYKLEPVLGRLSKTARENADHPLEEPDKYDVSMSRAGFFALFAVCAGLAILSNVVALRSFQVQSLGGIAVLSACSLLGVGMQRLVPKIPAVCWISLIAMIITYPGMPTAVPVSKACDFISFLPIVTPIMVFAGLSLAKDIPAFKRLGWRIVVTSLMATAGTFLVAAVMAQLYEYSF